MLWASWCSYRYRHVVAPIFLHLRNVSWGTCISCAQTTLAEPSGQQLSMGIAHCLVQQCSRSLSGHCLYVSVFYELVLGSGDSPNWEDQLGSEAGRLTSLSATNLCLNQCMLPQFTSDMVLGILFMLPQSLSASSLREVPQCYPFQHRSWHVHGGPAEHHVGHSNIEMDVAMHCPIACNWNIVLASSAGQIILWRRLVDVWSWAEFKASCMNSLWNGCGFSSCAICMLHQWEVID